MTANWYFSKFGNSYMLTVKSYSVPKINCFTYILFVTASALYYIYNVFGFASHIIINFESFILK